MVAIVVMAALIESNLSLDLDIGLVEEVREDPQGSSVPVLELVRPTGVSAKSWTKVALLASADASLTSVVDRGKSQQWTLVCWEK